MASSSSVASVDKLADSTYFTFAFTGLFIAIVAMLLAFWHCKNSPRPPYWTLYIFAYAIPVCVLTSEALSMAYDYYGLPKRLTSGVQYGGFKPYSCGPGSDTSNRFPCGMQELKHLLVKVATFDDVWSGREICELVLLVFCVAGFSVYFSIGYHLVSAPKAQEKRRRDRVEMEKEQEVNTAECAQGDAHLIDLMA